jgi:hypothetical protein
LIGPPPVLDLAFFDEAAADEVVAMCRRVLGSLDGARAARSSARDVVERFAAGRYAEELTSSSARVDHVSDELAERLRAVIERVDRARGEAAAENRRRRAAHDDALAAWRVAVAGAGFGRAAG